MRSKKRYHRHSFLYLDASIAVCAVAAIVSAVLLLIDFENNIILAPVTFGCAVVMDIFRAFKFYKREDRRQMRISIVEATVLLVICLLSIFVAI